MDKLHELLLQVEALSTPESVSVKGKTVRQQLEEYIAYLIERDFAKLIDLLYRVDISEKKLKALLMTSETNSAALITDLIIERQLQKKAMRQAFKPDTDTPEEERW